MKTFQISCWATFGLSIFISACASEPSCEDLATCPYVAVDSSSSSAGGSSSGDLPNSEDCVNGFDDDGNGETDCADAACANQFECVPAIPAGFSEIVTMAVTAYGEPVELCPDGTERKLYYQNAAKDKCDGCSCDTSAMTCTAAPLFVSSFFNTTCTQLKSIGPLNPGQCAQTAGGSLIAKNGPTATGSCQIQMIESPLLPPMETVVSTCSVTAQGGQGCGMGETCVPRGAIEGAEYLCLEKTGHQTCPNDWPVAIHVFNSFTDDRQGCSPCSCTSSCSGGQYTVFEDDGGACMTTGKVIEPIGMCFPTNNGIFGMGVTMSELEKSCNVTPGQMIGEVHPFNETTLCCR